MKSKIAIIGYGNIAQAIAGDLTNNNHSVILAGRDFTKAKALSDKLGTLARPMEIGAAIKEAHIIILAIWFNAIQPFFYQYEELLQKKIIIDPSNPIAPDSKGGFVKTIDQNESAGQLNAMLLPTHAILVKALGTLSASSLSGSSNQKPDRTVLFYASDALKVKHDVEELICDMGFAPLYIGSIDQSIRLEVFGDLHEFSLGKSLSLEEAKENIIKNTNPINNNN